MAVYTYEWREWMSLFRLSRITIDFDNQTVDFQDAIRTKSFWNLLPLRHAKYSFSDFTEISTYARDGYNCVEVQTADAKSVFLNADVPRFDEFADHFLAIAEGNQSQ